LYIIVVKLSLYKVEKKKVIANPFLSYCETNKSSSIIVVATGVTRGTVDKNNLF